VLTPTPRFPSRIPPSTEPTVSAAALARLKKERTLARSRSSMPSKKVSSDAYSTAAHAQPDASWSTTR